MGQITNPKARARYRRLNARRPLAELARTIGREVAEFTAAEGTVLDPDPETASWSRMEQLLRVLWTKALQGDLAAIRCLLEYMEGLPARQGTPLTKEEIETLSADVLAKLLEGAQARLREVGAEGWQQGSETSGGAAPTSSAKSG